MRSTAPREAEPLRIGWVPRRLPLDPSAAFARGRAATALARRLLALDDAALAELRGVAGEGWLLVVGATDALPWADGVVYLGRDRDAPALLVPTAWSPDVPVALLERALVARHALVSPPLAVLAGPPACVGAGEARPLERARLDAWAGRAR